MKEISLGESIMPKKYQKKTTAKKAVKSMGRKGCHVVVHPATKRQHGEGAHGRFYTVDCK